MHCFNKHGIRGGLPTYWELCEEKQHISKEITLAFPAIKTESYLKQLLLLGQFHIYGAVPVKRPQPNTRLHSKDLYSIDTPGSIIVRKIPLLYTLCGIFFFTEIVKFHLAVLPPLLLLAICEVQHRVLPQAVPFVCAPSVVWWRMASLVNSDSKFTCHFMCLISSVWNTVLSSHITWFFPPV